MNRHRVFPLLFFAWALVLTSTADARDGTGMRHLSVDDLLALDYVSEPAVSPKRKRANG